ncbi:MAG: DHHW family protein [Prevotellaceae bacterium]|nr:DHHW family protein [Prevotellaceae bacterium]
MQSKIYIIITSIVFIAIAIVFNFFPRSEYSELEKRELAVFPTFTFEGLKDGSFTKSVSSWFSDSEPFRDELMALSMQIKGLLVLETSGETVKFHASESSVSEEDSENDMSENDESQSDDMEEGYENMINADENAKIANAGIIVVGSGNNTRALMAFGGNSHGGVRYAEAANKYKETFGDKVNVYCMVIPTAVEYYCPDKAKKATSPQRPTINNIFSHLSPSVKKVDIYSTLGEHAAEDIFLRTDHHWAPLGAYYAAQKFAEVAGVPFKDLSSYDKRVVHGYVGSMYGYSKDISIKNAPEDFVYYVPRGVKYTTTYTNYTIDENYRVTGEGKPYKSKFFFHYRDGNGGAYCTFMGGDTKITVVKTSTKNGRRVIILKDSFGNAIPGYLFFSFEEIHVIDSRYFTKNMKNYVYANKITDILFANNIFKAYSSHIYRSYVRFLEQSDGTYYKPEPTDSIGSSHANEAIDTKNEGAIKHDTDIQKNEKGSHNDSTSTSNNL